MAPLGTGELAQRIPRGAIPKEHFSQCQPAYTEPRCGHSIPKFPAAPATWPHGRPSGPLGSHLINGKELPSEVLERTVSPEAHAYFRRILQVTQSELEKLIICKVQQRFDPVAVPTLANVAVDQLGHKVGKELQLPGAKFAAHVAELDGGAKGRNIAPPCSSLKEKAVSEGQDLTKCLVGNLGRILADFGRFADAVLRWQVDDGGELPCFADDSIGNEPGGEISAIIGLESGPRGDGFGGLLERLERKDRENTALESKYSIVSTELRENRRAFMRERQVWKEQMRRLRAEIKSRKDQTLLDFLDHDVQFFGGETAGNEEDIDDLRQRYEDRIAQMMQEYDDIIANMQEMIDSLKAKIAAMEELERSRQKPDTSEFEDLISELRAEVDELTEQLNSLNAQRDALKELTGKLRSDAETLRAELAAERAQSATLKEQALQAEALRAEAESLRRELGETKKQRDALEDRLRETQVALQAALSKPPPPPPPPVQLAVPKPQQQEASTQVSSKDVTTYSRESPSELTVSCAPTVDESATMREEVQELREHARQLEEKLERERELAALERKRLEEELAKARRKIAEVEATLSAVQEELRDKSAQCERLTAQCERLKQEKASQTARLEDLLKGLSKPSPSVAASVQTDPWCPEPAKTEEPALRLRIKELEDENAHFKDEIARLKALLAEAQRAAAELQDEIELLKRKIKCMELSATQEIDRATVPLKVKQRKSMGGGWTHTKRKEGLAQLNATQRSAVDLEGRPLVIAEEVKFDTPVGSRHASPRASAPGSVPAPTFKEEQQYRQEQEHGTGYALNYRPPNQAGIDKLCVNLIEQSQSHDSRASVSESDERQWEAIPIVSVPVSSTTSPPPDIQLSTDLASTDLRSSYGGGFSALETTAWKGASRPDVEPVTESAKALLPLLHGEPGSPTLASTSETSHVHEAPSQTTQPGPERPARPPSAIGTTRKAAPNRQQRGTSASGVRGGARRTQSVPDGLVSEQARAEGENVRLPIPTANTSASLGSLRLPPEASGSLLNEGRLRPSNYLHGPPERPCRPRSALVPLHGDALPSPPGVRRQRPDHGRSGSAIFDPQDSLRARAPPAKVRPASGVARYSRS